MSETDSDAICGDRIDGTYAHLHCNKFYKCYGGKTQHFTCPDESVYDPERVRCTYDLQVRPDCTTDVTQTYEATYAPAYSKPYSVVYPGTSVYYPYEYNSGRYQVMIANDGGGMIDRQDSVFLQYLVNSLGAMPLKKK